MLYCVRIGVRNKTYCIEFMHVYWVGSGFSTLDENSLYF